MSRDLPSPSPTSQWPWAETPTCHAWSSTWVHTKWVNFSRFVVVGRLTEAMRSFYICPYNPVTRPCTPFINNLCVWWVVRFVVSRTASSTEPFIPPTTDHSLFHSTPFSIVKWAKQVNLSITPTATPPPLGRSFVPSSEPSNIVVISYVESSAVLCAAHMCGTLNDNSSVHQATLSLLYGLSISGNAEDYFTSTTCRGLIDPPAMLHGNNRGWQREKGGWHCKVTHLTVKRHHYYYYTYCWQAVKCARNYVKIILEWLGARHRRGKLRC